MGMINYFFVSFSLPDPKIKTEYVWAEHRKRKVALHKKKNKNKKKPNQKPEIKLPSVTDKIQTVCYKC